MTIYLDHNATTPIRPRVEQAMLPWLRHGFGHPWSHDHEFGWRANEAVEMGRAQIAEAIGAQTGEIEFRASATDAIQVAIQSFVGYRDWHRKRIVTSATEHAAVLDACRVIGIQTGVDIKILPVDSEGHLDLADVAAALTEDKSNLLALMIANNEIGTITPVEKVAALARECGARFLCDLSQGIGKMPIDVHTCALDLAAFSAHKIYGPKGIGALFLARDTARSAYDSSQLRNGTPNVPGIVGFGEACHAISADLQPEMQRLVGLRDLLEKGIVEQVSGAWINGDRVNRLCNTTNIGLSGIDARSFIRYMSDIAISTSSACASSGTRPSHVLKAVGLNERDARSCLRFSLGRDTSHTDIEYTVGKVVASAHAVRRNKSAPARLA